MRNWTFLTNHAHVLMILAADPTVRLREISATVGITERAAQNIIADLCADEYVTREKVGRRNRYTVNPEGPLRHPMWQRTSVLTVLGTLRNQVIDHPQPAK